MTSRTVDASTLIGKHLAGYQGWFYTPNDGAGQGWGHWFRGTPAAATASFDLWPDVRELGEDELEATGLITKDGRPARLFSSYNPTTVARHFRWMAEAGIDGASLGRFAAGTTDARTRARLDTILNHVRRGAEAAGRVFFVWYDITGGGASVAEDLRADWAHLVSNARITESPSYLHHRGRPLVGVWGAGETSLPGEPRAWQDVVDFLKGRPASGTLLIGGPRSWHDDPIVAQADVVSPWSVAAFGDGDGAGADAYRRDVLEPDLALTRARGQDYLPVLWPGFSWRNLQEGGTLNAVPRRGGRFYWHQAVNAVDAGARVLFTAMFDEVDEGTAIFKAAETRADVPTSCSFLTLDADGERVSSDFYLRLAGAAGRMLRGEAPLTTEIPIPKEQTMILGTVIAQDKFGKKIGHATVEYWNQQDPSFGSNARFTDGEGKATFNIGFPAGVQPTFEVRADGFAAFKAYLMADGSVLDVATGQKAGALPDFTVTLPFA